MQKITIPATIRMIIPTKRIQIVSTVSSVFLPKSPNASLKAFSISSSVGRGLVVVVEVVPLVVVLEVVVEVVVG